MIVRLIIYFLGLLVWRAFADDFQPEICHRDVRQMNACNAALFYQTIPYTPILLHDLRPLTFLLSDLLTSRTSP